MVETRGKSRDRRKEEVQEEAKPQAVRHETRSTHVKLTAFRPNPYQPRARLDPEHIREIADSIAAVRYLRRVRGHLTKIIEQGLDAQKAMAEVDKALAELQEAKREVTFVAPGRTRALPLAIQRRVETAIKYTQQAADAIAATPITGVERQAAQVVRRAQAKAQER